jgi:hypothetical protein
MSILVVAVNGNVGYFSKNEISLQEAQELIGGYVEMTQLNSDTQLLVDEEGLLKQKAFNDKLHELIGVKRVGHAILLSGDSQWVDDEE